MNCLIEAKFMTQVEGLREADNRSLQVPYIYISGTVSTSENGIEANKDSVKEKISGDLTVIQNHVDKEYIGKRTLFTRKDASMQVQNYA